MSVYFITCRENGTVKIGTARNPVARLRSLQTSSPMALSLEATTFGSQEEEYELHKRFAAHRIRGEWFKLTEEIEALIQSTGFTNVVPIEKGSLRVDEGIEELVERSLREERETYAEWMRIRAKFDELFPLETPRRSEAA